MRRSLTVFLVSAAVFAVALLTGPPSFDATDGPEFAVCGSSLQIAHSPGYPLFLLLARLFTMISSPLYGHLRLLNCFLAAAAVPVGVAAFMKQGCRLEASLSAVVLLVFASPVMAQFNSLEIYPLAILLTLGAMALTGSALMPYAAGMAVFSGHPAALLASPLMFSKWRWNAFRAVMAVIPLTLLLYIPLRSGSSMVAHYGHPQTLEALLQYFTSHSHRLFVPSLSRLAAAYATLGTAPGIAMACLAAAGGRPVLSRDIPIALSMVFLASYELPDPAGQMWVLMLPLSLRAALGLERLASLAGRRLAAPVTALSLAVLAVLGTAGSDRRSDDAAMRWSTDMLTALPAGVIFRPVSHDAFYTAYMVEILGIRQDIILSDPFGNFFELMIPAPVPSMVAGREVYVSSGWLRAQEFRPWGLVFAPSGSSLPAPDWSSMDMFRFSGDSPDPMAMNLAAEAWARRMVQEEDPILRDSFYARAVEYAATPGARRRIENHRPI
jgi:hypothetical protein